MRRALANRSAWAALTTLFAILAGIFANIATSDWAWPVGVALVAFAAGWIILEALRAAREREPGDEPKAVIPRQRPAGSLPAVFNVPPRSPQFTGRADELARLRANFSIPSSRVQAVHGIGGAGKSQLAIEYAHRRAADYDVEWWIVAEPPERIGVQVTDLAVALGLGEPGVEVQRAQLLTKAYLRERDRWLLVFDNAGSAGELVDWLPGGAGHVLISGRGSQWGQIAVTMEIGVLDRDNAVALLRSLCPRLTDAEARRLATALGDLPLALVQAAGFLVDTGTSAREYLAFLDSRAAEVLDVARPATYPQTLTATVGIAVDRLREVDPAALAVATVGAFLAPAPVEIALLAGLAAVPPPDPAEPPGALAALADEPVMLRRAVAHLGAIGLATVTPAGFEIHRLTQAVLRNTVAKDGVDRIRAWLRAGLAASDPADPDDPRTWPAWARLLPHLLALRPEDGLEPEVRAFTLTAARYLLNRGDTATAAPAAAQVYERWWAALDPDEPDLLTAADTVARAHRYQGRWAKARRLDEETLARRKARLGEDHPDTLASTSNLARDLHLLAEVPASRDLNAATLERRRAVLGPDHPDTLATATSLAVDLRELQQLEEARALDEDTLRRWIATVGQDHPAALTSARNLASDLRDMGRVSESRDRDRDTLARRRRVLGDDHPDTLRSASNYALDLRLLGDPTAACELDGDTLARRRRVLGEEHSETLHSANNLAADLRDLGELEAARRLDTDTLARRRRVLGDGYPETLRSATNLLADLEALGDEEAVRVLVADFPGVARE